MPRGGANYIPRPDGDFAAWANQYYEVVKAFYDAQGLDPSLLTPLEKALADWHGAYPAHVSAQAAAEAARQAKDAARAALEQEVRPVTNFVQAWGGTTDANRAEMGITVRSGVGQASGLPTTAPIALVESGQRLTHHLRLVDQSTPTRRARPRGVDRAELFVALTPPSQPAPSDPRQYRYVRSITRGQTTVNFEPEEGGLQAHYLARWVGPRDTLGPWSNTASATVAA